MPALFAGFWVHGDTGEGHSVADHARAVHLEPARYGLSADAARAITGGLLLDTATDDPGSPRGRLILAACQRGWVRVRGRGNRCSIQGCRLARRLPAVLAFLRRQGFPDSLAAAMDDFASGHHAEYPSLTALESALNHGLLSGAERLSCLHSESRCQPYRPS